jgi:TetR/AcrR family transcriptional regulator, transcriptional repressor for nem operon
MARAKPTRERIIQAALYLFWLQGYAATGVAEILKRSRANAGSFYYFFKTKEELLLAVLETYVRSLMPVVVEPVFSEIADPIERVFGILSFYRRHRMHLRLSHRPAGAGDSRRTIPGTQTPGG